jgi:SAM-dependent methyltransferase
MPPEGQDPASRLIEWTGERLVPWADAVQTVYEHYHRYLWAASLVGGRRVLDLGSGEGYGTAILAGRAATATGIDVDPRAVEHSRRTYAAHENLEFRAGSVLELEALEAGAYDAVVAFEVIEHVDDHERVLEGVRHVLAPDGVLIVSTPDRRLYSDATGYENPYHEHELSEAEFRELLGGHFPHVALWGQRAITGSWIAGDREATDVATRRFFLEHSADRWDATAEPDPMYLIAIASQAPIAAPPPASLLADPRLELVGRWERETEQARAAEHREYVRAEHLAHDLMVMTADRDRLDRELREVLLVHEELLGRMRTVEESATWQLLQRARRVTYRLLGGRESGPARALRAGLRLVGRGRPRC